MNIKTAVITAAVQLLVANTNVIRKPEPFEELLNTLFNQETPEQKVARQTEEVVDKTVAAVQKMRTNRKFKKIVTHV